MYNRTYNTIAMNTLYSKMLSPKYTLSSIMYARVSPEFQQSLHVDLSMV